MASKYELPTVRSQLLEFVRDAYPETFEGLSPSKALGGSVFSGPAPHPNEVLNLFIQQGLTSALPIAYYMAARRGISSLMDRRLPRSTTLPLDVLQSVTQGLMALRELELIETHRLIFEPEASPLCSTLTCPSRNRTGPVALDAHRRVFNCVVGSSRFGTKVLQVPEFYVYHGGVRLAFDNDFCPECVEGWKFGHADLRRKVWAKLPEVFGLEG